MRRIIGMLTCIVLISVMVVACGGVDQKDEKSTTDTLVVGTDDVQKKALQNTQDQVADDRIKQESPSVASAQILEEWTWEKEGDYTLVRGSVLNDGDKPIGFFRIRAEYLNESGDVVDTDSTVYGEVVWPTHQKMFKISNKYDPSHFSVQIWLDEIVPAIEPVIKASQGTSAEIAQGWTWDVKGRFSYIKGSVKNTGEKAIHYYKIIAEYGDGQGMVLDSDFTNSNEKISPGGMQDFEIMHPYKEEFQEVTIYISNIK